MDDGERALVALSAALGAGDPARRAAAMRAAARLADPRAAEEALLQSYLFLGYPLALRALAEWRERTGREAPAPVPDEPSQWRERGESVCERVYGGAYGPLRERVSRLHPDLARWMLAEGYGKVLGRPGLALRARELCIVALLSAVDAPEQLHSHLRGALNVGVAPPEVDEALEIAGRVVGPARASVAWGVWEAVRARWESRDADERRVD